MHTCRTGSEIRAIVLEYELVHTSHWTFFCHALQNIEAISFKYQGAWIDTGSRVLQFTIRMQRSLLAHKSLVVLATWTLLHWSLQEWVAGDCKRGRLRECQHSLSLYTSLKIWYFDTTSCYYYFCLRKTASHWAVSTEVRSGSARWNIAYLCATISKYIGVLWKIMIAAFMTEIDDRLKKRNINTLIKIINVRI